MVVFLLKSSACLAIFLAFYKLFLEKERMHTFKRYYLLVALVLALAIPSITIIEYVEVTLAPTSVSSPVETITAKTNMPIAAETGESQITRTTINYWPMILWSVYGLGVLLFALKFFFNLRKIVGNVRNHPRVRMGSLIHVLMQDVIVPHTFFKVLF